MRNFLYLLELWSNDRNAFSSHNFLSRDSNLLDNNFEYDGKLNSLDRLFDLNQLELKLIIQTF